MRLLGFIAAAAGCAADGGDPDAAVEPPPHVELLAGKGTVTWSVVADAGAAEDGFVDCTYRRTYDALEDRSAPWLCPTCDLQLLAEASMPDADLDCYASVAGGAAPRSVERLGLQGDAWLRSSYEHLQIGPQGTVEDLGDGHLLITGEPTVVDTSSGTITLQATGELELTTVMGDPMHGFTPPEHSSCGWDVDERPAYEGPWRLEVGQQIPDGLFGDACGQGVRLHDLAGQYLVVDVSAADCGPCQAMAFEGREFEDAALRQLRDVELVTLLAPSLAAPLDPTSPELLRLWTDEFELDSPVLGDRGWGWALAATEFGELSYPTWIIASPSLEIIAMGQGFSGWQPILDTLMAHHE